MWLILGLATKGQSSLSPHPRTQRQRRHSLVRSIDDNIGTSAALVLAFFSTSVPSRGSSREPVQECEIGVVM